MNGVFKLLIDSGSSVTVLSKHLFDSFPQENRPDLGVVVLGVYVVVTLYSLADSQDRNFGNKTTRPRVKRLALLCWLTSHEEEEDEEEEFKKKVAAVKCSSIITMIEITKGTGGGGIWRYAHPASPPPRPIRHWREALSIPKARQQASSVYNTITSFSLSMLSARSTHNATRL